MVVTDELLLLPEASVAVTSTVSLVPASVSDGTGRSMTCSTAFAKEETFRCDSMRSTLATPLSSVTLSVTGRILPAMTVAGVPRVITGGASSADSTTSDSASAEAVRLLKSVAVTMKGIFDPTAASGGTW